MSQLTTRRPCVAGQFYPGRPESLDTEVRGFLAPPGKPEKAIAIIVPHAGYVYSGAVAGAVYAATVIPDDIILIGPNHTGLGAPASLMGEGRWETPLGSVPVNTALARLLIEHGAGFTDDVDAHLSEHSLEVQLPFIQRMNGNASIVPITIMRADEKKCAAMGAAVARAIRRWGKDVLIVVSSDMNHYEGDKETRAKDRLAIDAVLALDPGRLLDVTAERDISMCGVVPAAIAINAALSLGAKEARLVRYATSGETSGDYDHVVGYAGIAIR
ncbi:MAG: AmmeMemoRadiSam system protein B [Thermodesulfobacteriota bacterium]